MLTPDLRAFLRDMRASERTVKRATVFALTDSARDVHRMVRDRMERRFDRPTKYTLNSFMVWRADVRDESPSATVKQKTVAGKRHYVAMNEEGGERPQTALERRLSRTLSFNGRLQSVIPADGAQLDNHGNWKRSQRSAALAAVGISSASASQPPATASARASRIAYCLVRPGSRLSPGIWSRAKDGRISKIAHITDQSAKYRARLGLLDGANEVFSREFPRHFRRIMDRLSQQQGGGRS